jgi:hypothetical protein
MARVAKTGDLFGIEVECEGIRVNWGGEDVDILKDWDPHNDGSLRPYKGHPPAEWVFKGPVKYKKAVERVNSLFDYFAKKKATLITSNRTSIHVHFNMGDKTVYQLVNLYILFTIIEDLMDRYCGEDRNGNLFCLSSRHADEQLRWINDVCFKEMQIRYREQNRYCSLNLASMTKFGTVEFRGMRGLDNAADVLSWLSIINEFCDYACYKMNNPAKLIEEISVKRPVGFLREIFSKENFVKLTHGLDEDVIDQSIYEGLRLVQMLCYKIGTEFDQVRLRGRDFWASFKDDADPVEDEEPQKAKVRNPFANLAREGLAQARQGGIRLRQPPPVEINRNEFNRLFNQRAPAPEGWMIDPVDVQPAARPRWAHINPPVDAPPEPGFVVREEDDNEF